MLRRFWLSATIRIAVPQTVFTARAKTSMVGGEKI
jgi:hypothetical protein